jgi:endonuclease/exonuclease/phosphatase family metal-dependent hydrolase
MGREQDIPEQQTTAMSFNLRGGERGRDGVNAWNNREGLYVQAIHTANPDLIGSQEAQFGNMATYYERLRNEYHEFLGLDMDDGNFNPIFWKKGAFELKATGGFWLHPDQKPNTVAEEWDAAAIRCANWAVFDDNELGQPLCIINTHLDHISDRARFEGARLILRQWQEIGEDLPTLVTGDFNSGRYVPPELGFEVNYTDRALEVFENAGFVDVYSLFHEDGPQSNTFHGFKGDNYDPENDYGIWRIDYILARGLDPLSCDIIKAADPPVYPSDHYPVTAAFKNAAG